MVPESVQTFNMLNGIFCVYMYVSVALFAWVGENVDGQPGIFFYAIRMLGLCILYILHSYSLYAAFTAECWYQQSTCSLHWYVAKLVAFVSNLLWTNPFIKYNKKNNYQKHEIKIKKQRHIKDKPTFFYYYKF